MQLVGCRYLLSRLLVSAVLPAFLCLVQLVHAQARYQATFPMPAVVGLTIDEANERVLEAGRRAGASSARAVIVERGYDNRPAGRIVRQLEAPGTPMRPYGDDVGGIYGEVTYRVVVSAGQASRQDFPMPRIVGLTLAQAERSVLSAGREVNARSARAILVGERADERPAGLIVEQLERPGQRMVPYGDDVGGRFGEVAFRVVLSAGPQLAPEYIGKSLDQVRREAEGEDLRLQIGRARRDSAVPRGIVVDQDPKPGTPMSRRQVAVYPSAGFPLPDYLGRPVADAEADARKLRFALDIRAEENPQLPPGIVFSQDPGAGALLPLEQAVRLVVSRGWPVPDFVGKTESEVASIAREIRIELDVAEEDNPTVPAGIVFAQRPGAGKLIPENRLVSVVFSRGFPLPDLVGMHENEARQLAEKLGFRIEISSAPLPHRPLRHVDQQEPRPGTRLPFEAPVRVIVSSGWQTPDFIGKSEAEARRQAAADRITLTETAPREHFDLGAGTVIAQTPPAGAQLPADRRVDIAISLGWPIAPDAVGRPVDSVNRELVARHPGVNIDVSEAPLSLESAGTVISQRPEAGVKLDRQKRFTLVVAAERPVWLLPARS